MIIKTRFNLKDFVLIRDLKLKGRVISFHMDFDKEIQYYIKYFNNNVAANSYFFEDELELWQEPAKVGFSPK